MKSILETRGDAKFGERGEVHARSRRSRLARVRSSSWPRAEGATASYICNGDQECEEVDCLDDDDCIGGVCNTERHTCGDCRADADCAGFYTACDVETSECVECLSDAHCDGDFLAHCNPTTKRCAQCLTNADCAAEPYSPRCDTELGICSSCDVDADCALTDDPACSSGSCVACTKDAHCTDPNLPYCELDFSRCVECVQDAQCPSLNCDLFSHTCL